MCRCRDAIAIAALCLGVGPAVADDVTDYLERRGLDRLVAAHLEERLEATRDATVRQALTQRLAAVYGDLLERTGDREESATLERRATALLETMAIDDANELRAALIGARHRRATRTAESHRMRAASEEEVGHAAETFTRMLPELERLQRGVGELVRQLRQRLSRAGGVEATVLAERLGRIERIEAQTIFLRAWALYYVAMLERERRFADESIPLFARLLELPDGSMNADDVSRSLLEREAYARSLLGMALAQGFDRPRASGQAWLEVLAREPTHLSVRGEYPAWRLALLIDAASGGDFRSAAEELDALLGDDDAVPVAWLRLAAARGMERAESNPDARRLAAAAVGAMAARGEVGQVMDLARRFGGSALGKEGFVLRYVRGVERFEAARAAHDDDVPTGDPTLLELYDEAAAALAAALEDPESAAYRDGSVACRALLAWCDYYRGRLQDAAERFERVASVQRPSEAAESRWMAIVSLDRRVREQPHDADLRAALASAIERFLEEHPGSPRAGRLALRQTLDAEPSQETLDALRAVPAGSDAYPGAQRQIVQVLYRLTRDADGDERLQLAQEFLSHVIPTLDDDELRIAEGDASFVEGRIVRLRQAIEIALTPGLGRESLARAIVLRLADDPEASVAHASEIAFRRVQIAVAADDLAEAERWAAEVERQPDGERWRGSVARAMFRLALVQWRAAEDEQAIGVLLAVEQWGSIVLADAMEIGDLERRRQALGDPRMLPVLSGTAEATVRRWLGTRDPDAATRADALLLALLDVRPDDADAIRWRSILLEETDRLEQALALVRRLLAGTPTATEAWYEARYRQIDILRRIDPSRARAVMDQHRTLNPEYGPPPWDGRFEALDRRLRDEAAPAEGVQT